ncbi:MAG: Crp/Fnr family transcriptional regulator [Chitinophagales bacterium]
MEHIETAFSISSQLREKLRNMGFSKTFADGEIILNHNAYIKAIPLVTRGAVRVMRTEEEREILLYYIQPGESCIMSFLGGIHNDTSKVKAVADDETEVLFIPIHEVSNLMKDNPEWLDYIFWQYHKRFEELLDVVNAIAFKKLDERLLDFIKKKCALSGQSAISITHEQLAQEMGTARVVVSRLLKQMEESGLVQLGRNKISLL